MKANPGAQSAEAFFLYAETYLPDEASRAFTLRALEQCAVGTERETPCVATYVFRPSRLAATIGEALHPGSLALESTELYLTHDSFRRHLTTDEFRAGLRLMYKGTKRLGARLFWLGARPPSDMLHNIYRSDPLARPIAPISLRVFDRAVHAGSRSEDVVMVSLLCPVATGQGAVAIDAVDALDGALKTISLATFFHPLAPDLLRLFMAIPLDAKQPVAQLARALHALTAVADPARRAIGQCLTHRTRADLAAGLRAALQSPAADWGVLCDGYAGYISHPGALTESET